ncbi:MAG: DUF2442 domain-containing protein [Anaerolineae bacterium]|nr:DUF2442 domain-containing protein [Anaerolineae bacterium]
MTCQGYHFKQGPDLAGEIRKVIVFELEPSKAGPKVTNVTPQGIRVLLHEHELFLPFADFPWFRDATIGAILHVEQPHPGHLYWPDLDIDLAVESIEHPERYPLVSKLPPV